MWTRVLSAPAWLPVNILQEKHHINFRLSESYVYAIDRKLCYVTIFVVRAAHSLIRGSRLCVQTTQETRSTSLHKQRWEVSLFSHMSFHLVISYDGTICMSLVFH